MALHPDTDNNTTTNQPINQISLCRHRGNKRPISCQSASSDKGLRTNQLSVWIFWGNEQPISSLSGLHGVTAWPMSARQDRTVNPETVHTEAKRHTGESEDVREALLRREMF
ncbi:hypothetical protein NQZ68_026327 [Dissostichus eleginoides]|nr:hypothetical protein NQZ68_026327 [Dissostichus eleginoides]